MVARVASFEGVNVDVAEKTMDPALSIISPLMEGLPGYQGHLELVASDGRVLSIALFDSEENARAAEPRSTRRCRASSAISTPTGRAAASPSSVTRSSPTRETTR